MYKPKAYLHEVYNKPQTELYIDCGNFSLSVIMNNDMPVVMIPFHTWCLKKQLNEKLGKRKDV